MNQKKFLNKKNNTNYSLNKNNYTKLNNKKKNGKSNSPISISKTPDKTIKSMSQKK